MKDADVSQINSLIINFSETHEYIPFFSELENHKTFWPIFKTLPDNEKAEVKELIKTIILEKIASLKTKWWQLFQRFIEMDTKRFRKFRELNENEETYNSAEFQTMGKEIENEMFKLEWILTQAMLNRADGLGKTVDAFYKIVYTFFPNFNQIQ